MYFDRTSVSAAIKGLQLNSRQLEAVKLGLAATRQSCLSLNKFRPEDFRAKLVLKWPHLRIVNPCTCCQPLSNIKKLSKQNLQLQKAILIQGTRVQLTPNFNGGYRPICIGPKPIFRSLGLWFRTRPWVTGRGWRQLLHKHTRQPICKRRYSGVDIWVCRRSNCRFMARLRNFKTNFYVYLNYNGQGPAPTGLPIVARLNPTYGDSNANWGVSVAAE